MQACVAPAPDSSPLTRTGPRPNPRPHRHPRPQALSASACRLLGGRALNLGSAAQLAVVLYQELRLPPPPQLGGGGGGGGQMDPGERVAWARWHGPHLCIGMLHGLYACSLATLPPLPHVL